MRGSQEVSEASDYDAKIGMTQGLTPRRVEHAYSEHGSVKVACMQPGAGKEEIIALAKRWGMGRR